MSLSLLQAYSAMALNCTMPFAGAGGTPPYTYSVQAGGVGGTIDASSGVYTSPNSVSTAAGTPLTDTVIVTDSTANTASGTILCGNILNLVVDIIQQGMGFSQDQVYVYNQKYLIPTDSRVYVAVGMLNSKPFSNGQAQPNGNGLGTPCNAVGQYEVGPLDLHALARAGCALSHAESRDGHGDTLREGPTRILFLFPIPDFKQFSQCLSGGRRGNPLRV